MEAYATKTAAKSFRLSPIAFRALPRIKKPRHRNRAVTMPGAKCLATEALLLSEKRQRHGAGPTCVPMVPPTVE